MVGCPRRSPHKKANKYNKKLLQRKFFSIWNKRSIQLDELKSVLEWKCEDLFVCKLRFIKKLYNLKWFKMYVSYAVPFKLVKISFGPSKYFPLYGISKNQSTHLFCLPLTPLCPAENSYRMKTLSSRSIYSFRIIFCTFYLAYPFDFRPSRLAQNFVSSLINLINKFFSL